MTAVLTVFWEMGCDGKLSEAWERSCAWQRACCALAAAAHHEEGLASVQEHWFRDSQRRSSFSERSSALQGTCNLGYCADLCEADKEAGFSPPRPREWGSRGVIPGPPAWPAAEVQCPLGRSDLSGLGADKALRGGWSCLCWACASQSQTTPCCIALGNLL